jgi:hypothetical protein
MLDLNNNRFTYREQRERRQKISFVMELIVVLLVIPVSYAIAVIITVIQNS